MPDCYPASARKGDATTSSAHLSCKITAEEWRTTNDQRIEREKNVFIRAVLFYESRIRYAGRLLTSSYSTSGSGPPHNFQLVV